MSEFTLTMIGCGILWIIGCVIMNIIFLPFSKKIKINIKLPIPERYRTKVNPIYKLIRESYGDYFLIEKWELKYTQHDVLDVVFVFLIPYPIYFEHFRYRSVGSYRITKDEKEIYSITYDRMVEFYEDEDVKYREINKKEEEESNRYKTQLNTINKTFNENYE